MVDPEKIINRVDHLEALLKELSQVREDGYDSYKENFRSRLAAAHGLQLAIQACLDMGAHLIAEEALRMPDDYRGVFEALKAAGLEADLAQRLRAAAGMRNVLVHDYLKVDDEEVWGALSRLDDLRQFGVFAKSKLD